jgi:hypothetical protein
MEGTKMTRQEMKLEIVKLIHEKGQDLSLMDAFKATQEAGDLFLQMSKVSGTLLAPSKE